MSSNTKLIVGAVVLGLLIVVGLVWMRPRANQTTPDPVVAPAAEMAAAQESVSDKVVATLAESSRSTDATKASSLSSATS